MGGIKIDMVLGKTRERDGLAASATPRLFSGAGEPNGVITASKAGDEYIDTLTGKKRYSQAATDTARVEINYMI